MTKEITDLIILTIKRIHIFGGGQWFINNSDIVNFVYEKLNDRLELEEKPSGFYIYAKYTHKPVFEDVAITFGFDVSSWETIEFQFDTIDEYNEIPDSIWKSLCEFINTEIEDALKSRITSIENDLKKAKDKFWEYQNISTPVENIL